jgi:predicted HTH domain antitoxin
MQITLELPDLLVPISEEPKRAVFEAVALQAYAARRISQGKLAELLGLNCWQTEELLARRGISRPYLSEDLDREMQSLNETLS